MLVEFLSWRIHSWLKNFLPLTQNKLDLIEETKLMLNPFTPFLNHSSSDTSEFYQDGTFLDRPQLPHPMLRHCVVEVEPGLVFTSRNEYSASQRSAFSLNLWLEHLSIWQTWTKDENVMVVEWSIKGSHKLMVCVMILLFFPPKDAWKKMHKKLTVQGKKREK